MRFLGPAADAASEIPTWDQIPTGLPVGSAVADGDAYSNSISTSVVYVATVAIPVPGRYRVHGFISFTNPASSVNTFTTMDYTGTESGVDLHVTRMNLNGSLGADELSAMGISSGSATSGAFYRHDWWGFFTCSNTGTLRLGLSRGSSSATLSGQWLLDALRVA